MPDLLWKPNIVLSQAPKNIAADLLGRMYYGKAVIVTDKPRIFISLLRKQWLKTIRKKEIERARTLDTAKVKELCSTVDYMRRLQFTRRYPPDEYPGNVYIVDIQEALLWPPDCRTMYVTCPIEVYQRHLLTSWMKPHSTVVMYGKSQ